MSLSQKHASEIAELLNERNELTVHYTAKKVLEHELLMNHAKIKRTVTKIGRAHV